VSGDFVFRPVRSEDKSRVLEFTAHTWDDGDYIHDVFDLWLADADGQFTAVELDGRAIAIAKLTDLGEGEVWLEGLRVDPAHRQKGIGEALHNYQVGLARQIGARILRYATGTENAVSLMFGERTGFRRVCNFRWHVADASTEFSPPEPLSLDDLPQLRAWLDSPLLRSAHGLYPRLWKWSRLSEARLARHLRAGEVFGLPGASGLRAWSICSLFEGWNEAQMHHLDGADQASVVELAQSMRGYAASGGREKTECFALDPSPSLPTPFGRGLRRAGPSPLIDSLRDAGYAGEDFVMAILELELERA